MRKKNIFLYVLLLIAVFVFMISGAFVFHTVQKNDGAVRETAQETSPEIITEASQETTVSLPVVESSDFLTEIQQEDNGTLYAEEIEDYSADTSDSYDSRLIFTRDSQNLNIDGLFDGYGWFGSVCAGAKYLFDSAEIIEKYGNDMTVEYEGGCLENDRDIFGTVKGNGHATYRINSTDCWVVYLEKERFQKWRSVSAEFVEDH